MTRTMLIAFLSLTACNSEVNEGVCPQPGVVEETVMETPTAEDCTTPEQWVELKITEDGDMAAIVIYADSVGMWDDNNEHPSAVVNASAKISIPTCTTDELIVDCSITSTFGYQIPGCGDEFGSYFGLEVEEEPCTFYPDTDGGYFRCTVN